MQQKIYAAIDLGTNSCRASIAMASANNPRSFKIIERYSSLVRLGEGLSSSKKLSAKAISRTLDAIHAVRCKLDKYNLYKYRYIATEACRLASNSDEFLELVKNETGIELEIIDSETEATLAVLACANLIEKAKFPIILFDIGGGSSQISIITEQTKLSLLNRNLVDVMLGLPLGVVNLSERFCPVSTAMPDFRQMVDYVKNAIMTLVKAKKLEQYLLLQDCFFIGTSGTATILASLYLNLEKYDRRRVDGLWIMREDAQKIVSDVSSWDFLRREASHAVGAKRADLVIAGCAILSAIMEIWPGDRIQVADRGLRDGILFQLIKQN